MVYKVIRENPTSSLLAEVLRYLPPILHIGISLFVSGERKLSFFIV
jgi:hypothetical protein